ENQLPDTWRLGNRPNLTQMQAVAASRVSDDVVRARLLDEIGRCKALTAGASAAGVRVHLLPARPRDIEDDGLFHYGILGPVAASDSGKPSPEARRFLDETTSADKPRVYRNAVILLAPSRDGLGVASARVRDYLAWEQVRADLKEQEKEGNIDVARLQTLTINLDKARARVPDVVKQAYSTVITVSDKNEVQAFKINVSDEPHFTIIKNDNRSRIQDSSIAAEALLPDGPYNLWRQGETSRRVKDLAGAFAQMPHLPKMLKAQAIVDTLVEGCQAGAFVLRLVRPDGSARTWWHARPDGAAMADSALELVLPEAAELGEMPMELLAPGCLPQLWTGDALAVQSVIDYFKGGNVLQTRRNGYLEPVSIPKAGAAIVSDAVAKAVAAGRLWLSSGPASVLGEPIPAGVLTAQATLRQPPAMIAAAEILPENLPDAWANNETTALAIATALSQNSGLVLPWKTVRDVIDASLNARFIQLDPISGAWPCDYPSAQNVKLKMAAAGGSEGSGGGVGTAGGEVRDGQANVKWVEAKLEPAEVQNLGDAIQDLLDIRSKSGCPISFKVRVEVGDFSTPPDDAVIAKVNSLLDNVKPGFKVQ
ncbi:MAG: hypothetical protein PHC30_02940, partial [Lentisphaeria bacterium]|nr:hypothetical protein [Lentisphaeria bacterium]